MGGVAPAAPAALPSPPELSPEVQRLTTTADPAIIAYHLENQQRRAEQQRRTLLPNEDTAARFAFSAPVVNPAFYNYAGRAASASTQTPRPGPLAAPRRPNPTWVGSEPSTLAPPPAAAAQRQALAPARSNANASSCAAATSSSSTT